VTRAIAATQQLVSFCDAINLENNSAHVMLARAKPGAEKIITTTALPYRSLRQRRRRDRMKFLMQSITDRCFSHRRFLDHRLADRQRPSGETRPGMTILS
jgi:hypothetical protein